MKKTEVKAYAEKIQKMLFLDKYDLFIQYAKEDETQGAEVEVQSEYFTIRIVIFPNFFNVDEGQQRKAILHEFVHAVVAPLQEVAQDLLDGKLRTRDDLTRRVEETVSWITAIMKKMV